MHAAEHAELTDAIARGRLAPAEVAAVPPRELDALYALAVQYLDSGRDHEAAELLAGLVALFPYAARTWRAYAIALHRILELSRARAAYETALALEPGDLRTRCYRAEVWFYLGERTAALTELTEVARAGDARLARRAGDLIRLIERLAAWRPPQPPAPVAPETLLLCLHDQRPLPLAGGRFSGEPVPLMDEESTSAARIFAPIERAATDTALLPRRGRAPRPASQEATGTARVVRQRHSPGEPRRREGQTTNTAIVLRRQNAPLDLETDNAKT